MKCTTRDEAEAWVDREARGIMIGMSIPKEQAASVVRDNIGFAMGYYELEIAKRVYALFGAEHPYFGRPAEWASFTNLQLQQLGIALSQIAHGLVAARA